MLALAFSFSLFVFWTCLGRAVVSLAYPRIGVLRAWLVSPAIGLSVVLLGLMVLNQAGIPIRQFGVILTLVLGVAAAVVLAWRRPATPWRKGIPFCAAVVFALVWAGWPALLHGFKWLSYANDDMANYSLAAQRFMDHGFYDVPTMADLAGRDYASYFFFMHVADMMRFGAEHTVAWAATLARIPATQAFMPAILALSLVQVTAIGALVLETGRARRHALLSMWLLAGSPLFLFGSLYQLIAQVGGIGLLLTTWAMLTRRWVTPRRADLIRFSLLPGLTASALCIFYPELTPFAGLAFFVYLLIHAARRHSVASTFITVCIYTSAIACVLLRQNVISYISILAIQASGAMQAGNLLLTMFPYYLLPTGFSNLFGWMPLMHDFAEPYLSISVAAGMLLVVAVLVRTLRDGWRLGAASVLLLVQLAFAVRLFTTSNDFGLYKITMWMQPLLMAAVAACLLFLARGRRLVVVGLAAAMLATTVPTALYYSKGSLGGDSAGMTEVRHATEKGLGVTLPAASDATFTSTIENVVGAKFAASVMRGHPVTMVSRDYFNPTTRHDYRHPSLPIRMHSHFAEMAQTPSLIERRNAEFTARGTIWGTQFLRLFGNRPSDYYLSLDSRLSLFNKFSADPSRDAKESIFVVEPAAAVKNRLIFVHSELGNHYYLGDHSKVSFYQQERDYYAAGATFNGIGRFMLMRIEHPTPRVYLRISATRTLLTGSTTWSPAGVVRGADGSMPIGATGSGAFNLFVGPIAPRNFEGESYLAIDYAETPHPIRDFRTGLKMLYGAKIPADYRRLVGWARDISALSEAEYAALVRPRSISQFPKDLAGATTLEYSGAYEDGWLSPDSKYVFAGAKPGELVRVRGMVPFIPGAPLGTGTMRVAVNGQEVCEAPVPMGTFDWLVPVPSPKQTTTVELHFNVFTPLPGRDERPAAAKLEFLGLVEAGPLVNDYNQPHRPHLIAPGIDIDGWMRKSATLVLPPSSGPLAVEVLVDTPLGMATATASFTATLSGSNLTRSIKLKKGSPASLRIEIPAADDIRTVELTGPEEFHLAAPDTRRRSVRVQKIEVTPSSR